MHCDVIKPLTVRMLEFRPAWKHPYLGHMDSTTLRHSKRSMSLRTEGAQCGGVAVEFDNDNDRDSPVIKARNISRSALIYLKGPKFLIYVSGALSMWGDRMWHFAISVFLIELYGHNLLLTGIFGLVVAGSVLLLGALIGDWVDRNPRNKVAHASLFIQNISVTICSIVLMLVFSYKKWIEEIWDGWLTVVCYTVVIVLADVANLASTALTIAIQRDWIVVITGYNRGHLAEFIFLSRVYRIVPALSVKPPAMEHQSYLEKKRERKRLQEESTSLHLPEISRIPVCLHRLRGLLSTCREGWRAYYRQPVFLAGLGLAFLYTTVLGFDCITTGYAYTQGISGSLLSILMGVSAVAGLLGTVLFTKLRKACGLVNTGVISSALHLVCLLLCLCSVFAPGSPMDLSVLNMGNASDVGGMTGGHQRHGYPLRGSSNQPLLPDRSSIHWTNNTVLFENAPAGTEPESYVSIILLCCCFPGLWSFDLTVTQILQETICESERGVVNGVQSSMNYLMDLLHFLMVISAPQPQHFGILVIISILFIFTGHTMYFLYARKVKRKPRTNT
ncbi:Solute carrier family 40 member 1 [Labeo rohita]|uniref:Solute carrier family 40 member n=1 Tax=Labeo rohita TaxID=84645 RepID=A0ABQ8LXS9_LABRO|nr:Solute carrier family 40 member 1 [Labeo rohita]